MLSTAAASTVHDPEFVHASEPLIHVQALLIEWVTDIGWERAATGTVVVILCVKLLFRNLFQCFSVSLELGYGNQASRATCDKEVQTDMVHNEDNTVGPNTEAG